MSTKRKLALLLFTISLFHILIRTVLVDNGGGFVKPISNKMPNSISVLAANVGNLNLGCRPVLNNLCYKDVEYRISENIKILRPDIIALQELLAPWQCEEIQENNQKKVCSNLQTIPQVRRLVGNNYSIACTSRNQFECIAVHTDVGKITGCPIGELCNTARTGIELPDCDNGFSVSAITVELNNKTTFDVVNVHPQSTNAVCRSKMISLIFGNQDNIGLVKEKKVLVMGDFNLDPWRDNDESVKTWSNIFEQGWAGQDFLYHSASAEKTPPHITSTFLLKKRTFDFVVSNFATGVCKTLGESENTVRLDDGMGMDHRAIFGVLDIKE